MNIAVDDRASNAFKFNDLSEHCVPVFGHIAKRPIVIPMAIQRGEDPRGVESGGDDGGPCVVAASRNFG